MLRGLLTTASRYLHGWSQVLAGDYTPAPELFLPAGPRTYRKLDNVVLADEVSRTLFRDYAEHRAGPRGAEEVGWVLLGLREEATTFVLATLPAGADREAGVAHVHFNSTAQAVASRIIRQTDRRLGIVGVVHTHPGTLRHPSDGDYRGDSVWVGRLRGGEGVFGIGTADGKSPADCHYHIGNHGTNGAAMNGTPVDEHVRTEGGLCFSWYALGDGDRRYRRLPVEVAPGPDLARQLHSVWDIIERHALALDGLCRQLARVQFEVSADNPALLAQLPVCDSGDVIRVQMCRDSVRLQLDRGGVLTTIPTPRGELDQAVFLALAELSARKHHAELGDSTGSRSLAIV